MKKIIMISFISIILCASIVSVSALETYMQDPYVISPLYNNVNSVSPSFSVIDPGEARVTVTYVGKASTITNIKVTVKIQKKVLGLFWTTVDIGEPNNQWVTTSNNTSGILRKTFSVSGHGTYRAIFNIEISGTNTSPDVIENIIESKYN